MKITYQNRFLDIVIFNLYHLSRSPIAIGIIVGSVVLLSVPIWQATLGGLEEHSLSTRLLTFLILDLLILGGLVFVLFLLILLSNISKMNKTVLTDTVINLTPDFMIAETRFSRSEIKWSAIQKLARTRSHIYLYMMQHGALAIPRRAFESTEAWEEFWRTCQERTKAA